MSIWQQPRLVRILSGVIAIMFITASALAVSWQQPGGVETERESFASFIRSRGLRNPRLPIAYIREKLDNGAEAQREALNGPAQEQYDNRAYPGTFISYDRAMAAAQAYSAIDRRSQAPGGPATNVAPGATWKELGPITPVVPGVVTYTGRATTNSGRVTTLALAPGCTAASCTLYVGAAGGGVWKTTNAMAAKPNWKPMSNGIPSNAIGTLLIDPHDATGQTLYVGTGEPSGSSDSEAGVGLYKSTDGGANWALVAGSLAVAKDRGIGALAIDPADADHIFIGTAVARHGSSSANGGRFTPPNAPEIGLYESTDGGATFTLAFSQEADPVNPGSANGSDFFRGGISALEFAPDGTLYLAMMSYGLYRADGAGDYEMVFASAAAGDIAASANGRTEFALAPNGDELRIYVGDTDGNPADLYRLDDANVAASTLVSGTENIGWTKLSDATPGTPGFGSYDFCGGQCSYDMFVASPKGQPDVVWLGGQMQYGELIAFGSPNPRSNGRAVLRSTDAGVNFTDMTNDTQAPPHGMHPDQHAIVFHPDNPGIAFIGSDGGVVRTDGSFADDSAECAERGLNAADLANCEDWLSAVPRLIYSLNDGLATLQFQSVSVNGRNAVNDIIGGTQDNGTWAYSSRGNPQWFESVGGDGGQSGIDVRNPNIRIHSYFNAQHDVNFRGNDPLGWNYISEPLQNSNEAQSFYPPLTNDPRTGGMWFVGLQHVWRTTNNGGTQAFLEQYCNELTGDFANRPAPCGNWEPLGGPAGADKAGDLVSAQYGADKGGSYVVAIERARADKGTLWVGTRRGRLFIAKNANAADPAAVTFTRIDSTNTPTRFISGIAVDRSNPNRAWVSFSGYNAHAQAAGTVQGHVFEVVYNPASGSATWTDISHDIGDQPITDVARDHNTGDLFASTDFGVLRLASGGTSWVAAAPGLPPVAVYGLTVSPAARTLFAATHGRGIWRLRLR